jgi:hypothetical protein
MVFQFPDYDTLRLALTSGVVPTEVSLAPAAAGVDETGRPWIEPTVKVTRAVAAKLAKMGVKVVESSSTAGAPLSTWMQALPLVRDRQLPDLTSNTPVLFELPETRQLPEIVGEMLRLAVDRQSFRWVRDSETETGTVLLRVVGPPYYTLLRAIDGEPGRNGSAVRAYVEKAPRVWVEVGWDHPLAKGLEPPEGQALLLRPPHEWVYLDDAPFQDIYEILDFKLPHAKVNWEAAELKKHLIVPLRLIEADRQEPELWVLRQNAMEQLDALVRDAKESLIRRLIFAVGEHDGQTTIVLRVRPSKQPPPALVFDAEAYSKYLKLDNLFVPVGTKIHPALRRDAVRTLLAEDLSWINWLRADPQRRGGFIPEGLPDEAFRPLQDWVDYVLDHDRETLTHWVQEFRFDFDPFVCPEEQAEARKAAIQNQRKEMAANSAEPTLRPSNPPIVAPVPPNPLEPQPTVPAKNFSDIEIQPPSRLQLELAELEKSFQVIDGPLDDPRRLRFWPDMAAHNAALKHGADAGICWANLLWELLDLDIELADLRKDQDERRQSARRERWQQLKKMADEFGGETELAWQWVRSEKILVEKRLSLVLLDQMLANDQPAFHEVRGLVACLVWGARDKAAAKVLLQRLPQLQQYLEQNEATVGLRPAWLGWHSLARLSGDALALARVRDRLIERLVNEGYSAERDLPQFLLTARGQDGDRVRAVQSHMNRLHILAAEWYEKCEGERAKSVCYVDLIFSYGLARLGQAIRSRELLRGAESSILNAKVDSKSPKHSKNVHGLLLQAFRFRIEQALQGRPNTGLLPTSFREALDKTLPPKADSEMTARYSIDRMIEQSQILERQERFNPYRFYEFGETYKRVALLPSIRDSRELQSEIQGLLKPGALSPPTPQNEMIVLIEALPIAARAGETFTLSLVGRVEPLLDRLSSPDNLDSLGKQAQLLGRTIFMSANYNRADTVQRLLPRFPPFLQQSLQRGITAQEFNKVNQLFEQCLRSLQKLNLRDDIDRLINQVEKLVFSQRSIENLKVTKGKDWPMVLTTLLYLASGWLLFGRNERVAEILEAARELLFSPADRDNRDGLTSPNYVHLAVAYANVLGRLPAEVAIRMSEEMFQRMRLLQDGTTSNVYLARLNLNIIEAVVLALVSEDFAMGPSARKWMDDDEFLIRRRIHRDHRAMLAKA